MPIDRILRPGPGVVLFSTWSLGTPQRQRAAVRAQIEVWEGKPWPTPDLLSYTVFAGADGDHLLHHSRWTSEAAYHAFFSSHRPQRVDDVDAAVPGIVREGVAVYRPYRTGAGSEDRTPADGFGVRTLVLDAPDPGRLRAWADELLDTEARPPGLLAVHPHLSVDGTRGLALTEWSGERAGNTTESYRFEWRGERP